MGGGDEEGTATERVRRRGLFPCHDRFLATTDSIRQQHRTAFCALKHTRSSYKPAVYYVDSELSFDVSSQVYGGKDFTRSSYKPAIYYVDSGMSFDASSKVYGGEDLALAAGGGRARRTGRYI